MFIPQDNTGTVPDANAYVDVPYYKQYFLNRNKPTAKTDDEIQGAIVEATAFIDSYYCFIGGKLAGDIQTTEFPRYMPTSEAPPATVEIPTMIKNATCEYSAYVLDGGSLAIPIGGELSGIAEMENKVGEISERIEYIGSSSESVVAIVPIAGMYMGKSGWLCPFRNVIERS